MKSKGKYPEQVNHVAKTEAKTVLKNCKTKHLTG